MEIILLSLTAFAPKQVNVLSCLSPVQRFVTPWTASRWPPLSMEFSRQEYWRRLPCPCPGIFLTQGSNSGLLHCRWILYPESPGESFQFSSVAQLCPTLCDPMECSMLGFPVHHQLPELVQTHHHQVSDAIQPSHPLLSPSPPAFNLSQCQSLFQ